MNEEDKLNIPMAHYWKGREIDTLTAEELRQALKELCHLYTSLLEDNIRRHALLRGRI